MLLGNYNGAANSSLMPPMWKRFASMNGVGFTTQSGGVSDPCTNDTSGIAAVVAVFRAWGLSSTIPHAFHSAMPRTPRRVPSARRVACLPPQGEVYWQGKRLGGRTLC